MDEDKHSMISMYIRTHSSEMGVEAMSRKQKYVG